ncbi:hypothetical protein [Methanoculleus bourgensis]|uniref:Uncharacterized protein n=1 Tax=Methanoculleus bourgensis TaxID=83986 RepID=A0A0X8XYF9_9EURY|nr:hypothetical protein [Methanoculleus bourgensis]CVK34470.1 conserved protein of unknown function [Methanoculleus bourgensis]
MTTDPKPTVAEPCWWRAVLTNPYIVGPIKFVLPFAIATALFVALYLMVPYQQFLTLSGWPPLTLSPRPGRSRSSRSRS